MWHLIKSEGSAWRLISRAWSVLPKETRLCSTNASLAQKHERELREEQEINYIWAAGTPLFWCESEGVTMKRALLATPTQQQSIALLITFDL